MRVLVAEENADLRQSLIGQLKRAEFAVDAAVNTVEAETCLHTARYDIALFGRIPPQALATNLVKAIRGRGFALPVMILVDSNSPVERAMALEAGADDCLSRRFDSSELLARVRSLLRRPHQYVDRLLTAGNLTLDSSRRTVTIGGRQVYFGPRETALLEQLLRCKGRPATRTLIEESLYCFEDEVTANSIDVVVSRLRTHLRCAGASVFVRTLRSVGYMLDVT